MKKNYSKLELLIITLFNTDKNFTYNGEKFETIFSEKPRPKSGECKTDVYVLAKNITNNKEKEFKISVKQSTNSSFLENKLTIERAYNIFGTEWNSFFKDKISDIAEKFKQSNLIFLEKKYPTKKNSITLGWKAEISDKNRNLAVKLPLDSEEINRFILKGENLTLEKKNSLINNREIKNSGIAEYIIYTKESEITSTQDIIDKMQLIDDFDIKTAYLIFTAHNYRPHEKIEYKGKIDGNRTLALPIKWEIINNKLTPNFLWEDPLRYKGKSDMMPFLIDCLKKLGKDSPSKFNLKQDVSSMSYVYKGLERTPSLQKSGLDILILNNQQKKSENNIWDILETYSGKINHLYFGNSIEDIKKVDVVIKLAYFLAQPIFEFAKEQIDEEVAQITKVNPELIIFHLSRRSWIRNNSVYMIEKLNTYGYIHKTLKFVDSTDTMYFNQYLIFCKKKYTKDFIIDNKILMDNNMKNKKFHEFLRKKYIYSNELMNYIEKRNLNTLKVNVMSLPFIKFLEIDEVLRIKNYPEDYIKKMKNENLDKKENIKFRFRYDFKEILLNSIYNFLVNS